MTPHTDALSGVYARSLYELAEQAGGRDKILEIADEIEQVCELARDDRGFREFLGSPIVDRQRRGEHQDRARDTAEELTLESLPQPQQ